MGKVRTPVVLVVIAFSAMSCQNAPTRPDPVLSPATTTVAVVDEIARVVKVTDGDTIRVLMPDGKNEPVRLIGIDSPEDGSVLDQEATAYLEELVLGEDVRLVVDVSDRDRFDRLLRYVYVGDLFVNEEMVRVGLAIARRYEPDTAMASILEAAQGGAEQAALGLFSVAITTTPTTTASTQPTTTTQTPTTAPPTTTSVPDPSTTSGVPQNPGDSVNCSDFGTHAEAQAWFNSYHPYYGDVAGLDGDGDGIACESLP